MKDISCASKLSAAANGVYKKEADRQWRMNSLFKDHWGIAILPFSGFPGSTTMGTDGTAMDSFKIQPYAIFEYEKELGSTWANKFFQGQAYYARMMEITDEHVKRHGNMPCFLLEVQGPCLR